MGKQTLELMNETFTIHSFSPADAIPDEVYAAPIYFIGKTYDELSIVVPSNVKLNSQESESGWGSLEVLGPLGFSMTGILSKISGVLAESRVSIFAISTFDTDYILVKQEMIPKAIEALRLKGYTVVTQSHE
ncbi:ACT domain-containing protein [Algicola sagamiensis]|uniref:ACT domain-containing protein n=1 Tax=Algicola sagamiensis TaxID=163869 RepID=UPI000377EFC1|nr:ACT domain-containing protein [Algicola sagamiensis]